MNTEEVAYEADGLQMKGWLVYQPWGAERRPGVLVYPPAPGPGRQMMAAAQDLADQGYVAMVCDLYGDGRFFDPLEPALELLAPLRRNGRAIRARARGAFDLLAAHPMVDAGRIASIGYCFGGLSGLELARSGADLKAVVGFHTPVYKTDLVETDPIKAAILICTGSEDREIGPDSRAAFEAEMRERAVKDWSVVIYGGAYHSFTNPDADSYGQLDYARYDARAHARSWRDMSQWLEEAFSS